VNAAAHERHAGVQFTLTGVPRTDQTLRGIGFACFLADAVTIDRP
jgi:hypothetical protein